VLTAEGVLLLPAGTKLTAKSIATLASWEIPLVNVKSGALAPNPADLQAVLSRFSPEEAHQLEIDTRVIFRSFNSRSPLQQEVFRQVLLRKARQVRPD
jgi:hypothetical protein